MVDNRHNAAIKLLNKNIPIYHIGRGNGYVWADLGAYVVYSSYFFPNADPEQFKTDLVNLFHDAKRHKKELIICGDFNAKVPEWGMAYSDGRGHLVTEWMAGLDLVAINVGGSPTFVRGASSSVIVISLITSNLSGAIRDWRVLEDESLSCHRYIAFTVENLNNRRKSTPPDPKSWTLKRLEYGTFCATLNSRSIDTAEELVTAITETCDNIIAWSYMRRLKPVYWWSQPIAMLRRASVKARRAYTRRNLAPSRREELRVIYKAARKELRQAIKQQRGDAGKLNRRYRQRYLGQKLPHNRV
nr:unnamed protein product [Callosobruchus analis]